MKKLIFAIMALAVAGIGNNAYAQGKYGADSAECLKYLSYYQEYFKQKSYDEALPNWRKAYSICPATASQNLLINGATLIKRLIGKNVKNASYKAALIDTLTTLYKTRAEVYPKYAVTAYNNLALDCNNYIKNNPEKLYGIFEEVIAANAGETKPTVLLFDLNTAIELYQNSQIDAEKVIGIYERNIDFLEGMTAANDEEAAQNKKIKEDMGSIFAASKVASCETLVELYGPRIAAEPENLQLATSIVKTMSLTDGCNDNDVFLAAVTAMDKMNPSASSAYYLYRLHGAKGNVDQAVSYLEKALASPDADQSKLAEWTFELATFCFKNGQSSKAFECANKAASMSEGIAGKAYFLIGNIWASTRCGSDDISRRAPYWVACDYMAKAKNADPSLAEDANRYIGQYSSYFPQAAEAFMFDVQAGQSYTVVCGGMRATTTVRTNK